MTEPTAAPAAEPAGQASATPVAGTTAPAPVATQGQGQPQGSPAPGQAAPVAPAAAAPAEPTFFDPKDLNPDLLPAYRHMQGTFTRKMQEISGDRDLLQQARAFMADPVTGLQQLAAQHGFTLTRAQAQAVAADQGQPAGWDPRSGESPPDWETLLSVAESRSRERLMQEFGPVVQNVHRLQAQSVEQQLNSIDPEWKTYEPKMRDLLKETPSLGNNIQRLYNLALLEEGVFESRAVKIAQDRLRASASAARVGGTSTTTSQPAPKKVNSFDDAVEEARRQLASGSKR